jgi:hypothetical protein
MMRLFNRGRYFGWAAVFCGFGFFMRFAKIHYKSVACKCVECAANALNCVACVDYAMGRSMHFLLICALRQKVQFALFIWISIPRTPPFSSNYLLPLDSTSQRICYPIYLPNQQLMSDDDTFFCFLFSVFSSII